jgi:hypothetical protein
MDPSTSSVGSQDKGKGKAPLRDAGPSTSAKGKVGTGAGKKKTVDDVSDLQVEQKEYTATMLHKMRCAALARKSKHVADGLRFVRVMDDGVGSDGQLTAGYLNMHSIQEMRAFAAAEGTSIGYVTPTP